MRRRFQARVREMDLSAGPVDTAPVSDDDIATLPTAAQRYLRFIGIIGRTRDWSFRARFVGEFRQQTRQKFMPCEAWQYNTRLIPARIYYMRIDFAGVLPMFGVDLYQAGHGRMRGKLLGMITVPDGSGPEFDLGELTTYVNDALMLAPSMLLTPAVTCGGRLTTTRSTSACPMAQSRPPHGSMSMSRAAWSTSAPPIAGQLSRAD
jgi:hypothetical protein